MSDEDSKPGTPAAGTAAKTKKPARKRGAARVAQTPAAAGDATATPAAPAETRQAGNKDGAPAAKPAPRKARGKPQGGSTAAKPEVTLESAASETRAPAAPVEPVAPLRRLLLSTRLDVRWGDMDAFNHVNNAVFLSYLEEARLRWLQGLSGPWLDDNTAPLLAAAHVDYRRPIEWPCTLAIELYADRVGNSSLTLGHRIIDSRDGDVVFSEGHTVMVWIDRRNGKGSKLPDAVRRACIGS